MSFKQDLIRLGTTNPNLRPHIRQLLAGCEKLPEGGMRDNCEKKKNEGGDKEAGEKTAKLMSRQEAILKKYLDGGGNAMFFDDLPTSTQKALSAVKDQETLDSDVDRWLGDNNNPHLKRASFRNDLIKLGTTNPELRPQIREILAGCEKLPEGGMRDNCEAKKNEGGEKKDDKKEAADKTADLGGVTYLNRMPAGLIPMLNRVDDAIGGDRLQAFAFVVRLLNLVNATDEARFIDRYLARNRRNVELADDSFGPELGGKGLKWPG